MPSPHLLKMARFIVLVNRGAEGLTGHSSRIIVIGNCSN